MLKSAANVETLPSDNLYWVVKSFEISVGSAEVKPNVLPEELPVNVADQVVPVAGSIPIVVPSTFAVTFIDHDGPAS